MNKTDALKRASRRQRAASHGISAEQIKPDVVRQRGPKAQHRTFEARLPYLRQSSEISWPSGRGEEVGVIRVGWWQLHNALISRGPEARRGVSIIEGERGFVFLDLMGSPVTLMESDVPGILAFSIIADRAANKCEVLLDVQRRLGSRLRVEPAPHLLSAG